MEAQSGKHPPATDCGAPMAPPRLPSTGLCAWPGTKTLPGTSGSGSCAAETAVVALVLRDAGGARRSGEMSCTPRSRNCLRSKPMCWSRCCTASTASLPKQRCLSRNAFDRCTALEAAVVAATQRSHNNVTADSRTSDCCPTSTWASTRSWIAETNPRTWSLSHWPASATAARILSMQSSNRQPIPLGKGKNSPIGSAVPSASTAKEDMPSPPYRADESGPMRSSLSLVGPPGSGT
mmetsp:Transcript_56396/g.129393  ORF Transcript_56396/g.129393 Transcript_56396/m.129393 type:complete len:236 (+) Transcript_56396:304-1011(+)